MMIDLSQVVGAVLFSLFVQINPVSDVTNQNVAFTDQHAHWAILSWETRQEAAALSLSWFDGETAGPVYRAAGTINKDKLFEMNYFLGTSLPGGVVKPIVEQNYWRTKPSTLWAAAWDQRSSNLLVLRKTEPRTIGGRTVERQIYTNNGATVSLEIDGQRLIGFGLSQDGKAFEEAEYYFKRQGPTPAAVKTGAYSTTSPADPQVITATVNALELLRTKPEFQGSSLQSLDNAEIQIVAGQNFRLGLTLISKAKKQAVLVTINRDLQDRWTLIEVKKLP